MNSGNEYRRALVASQFHRARRQAAMETLLSRLTGKPSDLLSFDEVVGKLGIHGRSQLGVHNIPLESIIGSVGRYQDFTRTFLPRRESDEERWVKVGAAASSVADLPPIDVYKVGDVYFVLDGNHRVSLARQQGLTHIDAVIIEVRTRAKLPPGASPDDLIIAAEQAEFLAYTRLDVVRPEADMSVSVPGQFRHLENHIEAYRFILETSEERTLDYEEAVLRWYDEAYLPLIEAIREQGVLRYFPGRTETDFFVWLARHRARLQKQMGLTITPDMAVSRLADLIREPDTGPPTIAARLRRWTRLSPPQAAPAVKRSWAEERMLGRYSGQLFGSILLPVAVRKDAALQCIDNLALDWAMTFARAEAAQLCALCVFDKSSRAAEVNQATDCLQGELAGLPDSVLLTEIGDATRSTLKLAFLYDLVIIERAFNPRTNHDSLPTVAAQTLLAKARRPAFIPGEGPCTGLFTRMLLVHDTARKFDEALFIGAYLAEKQQLETYVLPSSTRRLTSQLLSKIEAYLQLHEVEGQILDPFPPDELAADHIVKAARHAQCDLIVLSLPARERDDPLPEKSLGYVLPVLREWNASVIIAA